MHETQRDSTRAARWDRHVCVNSDVSLVALHSAAAGQNSIDAGSHFQATMKDEVTGRKLLQIC